MGPSSIGRTDTKSLIEDFLKFRDPQPFDWFKGWEELKGVLGPIMAKEDRILMV